MKAGDKKQFDALAETVGLALHVQQGFQEQLAGLARVQQLCQDQQKRLLEIHDANTARIAELEIVVRCLSHAIGEQRAVDRVALEASFTAIAGAMPWPGDEARKAEVIKIMNELISTHTGPA